MNRERLTILRDHLAGLPDEDVDMMEPRAHCGTACCIGGWANRLFAEDWKTRRYGMDHAAEILGLTQGQTRTLFYAINSPEPLSDLGRVEAVSALQSMLDSPADDALPVWPAPVAAA